MSDMATINLNFLKITEFNEITARLTTTQSKDGLFVSYLTLTVNEETGEILDIAKSARVFEGINILSSPIAIKRESLFDNPPNFKLELINQGDAQLPDRIRTIVEQAFMIFNTKV